MSVSCIAFAFRKMSSLIHLQAIPDALVPLIYGAASVAVKIYLYAQEGRRLVPPRAKLVGRVTQLNLFPVKSLDGIQVDQAECTSTGLKLENEELYDRFVLEFLKGNVFICQLLFCQQSD